MAKGEYLRRFEEQNGVVGDKSLGGAKDHVNRQRGAKQKEREKNLRQHKINEKQSWKNKKTRRTKLEKNRRKGRRHDESW